MPHTVFRRGQRSGAATAGACLSRHAAAMVRMMRDVAALLSLALMGGCVSFPSASPSPKPHASIGESGARLPDGELSREATAQRKASEADEASDASEASGASEASAPQQGAVVETRGRLLAPAASRCPPEMALVAGRVCVDRYEASLLRVEGGAATPHSPHHPPPKESRVRAVAAEGVLPQAHISGAEAGRACRDAGKRLCSAHEWESACRGPADTTYPYGRARREGVCNDDSRDGHPVAEVTRRAALDPDRMWYENMHHPQINQLPNTLERGGAHAECRSGYGAYDMVGNLHEWIDDPEGTFRGGFFMDTQINGEGCNYATTAHGMDYRDYSTGFRCCRDPEPLE